MVDGIAAGAPVRELLLIEPFGHARILQSGVDNGVAGEARATGSKYLTCRGGRPPLPLQRARLELTAIAVMPSRDIIVIGGSAGAIAALQSMFADLPELASRGVRR